VRPKRALKVAQRPIDNRVAKDAMSPRRQA